MTKFEDEYPESAAFLAMIYAEPPHYHRKGAMHYFTKTWHFRHNGECVESEHKKLNARPKLLSQLICHHTKII